MISGVRVHLFKNVTALVSCWSRPGCYDTSISRSENDGSGNPVNQYVDPLQESLWSLWDDNQTVLQTVPAQGVYADAELDNFPFYNASQGKWGFVRLSQQAGNGKVWPYPDLQQSGYNYFDSVRLQQIEALLHPNTSPSHTIATVTCKEGKTIIPAPDCWGVDVHVLTELETDHWYAEADIAKYGFVSAIYDTTWQGPLQWVNFASSRLVLQKEGVG